MLSVRAGLRYNILSMFGDRRILVFFEQFFLLVALLVWCRQASALLPTTAQSVAAQRQGQKNGRRAIPDNAAIQEATVSGQENRYASSRAYAHYLKGLMAVYQGVTGDAIEEFKLATIFDPESPVLRVALAHTYQRLGLEKKALEQFKRALQSDPAYVPAYLAIGKIWLLRPQTRHRAISVFRKAIRLAPREKEAYLALLHIYLELGKFKKAVDVVGAMEKVLPWESAGFQELGQWLARKGRWRSALRFLNKAQERDPENTNTLMLMAGIYQAMNRNADAEKYYSKLLAGDSENADALYALGALLLGSGDIAGAVKYWKRLLVLSPEDAGICAKIAVAFAKENRLSDAVNFFASAHATSPDDTAISFFWGRVLEEIMDYPGAVQAFAKIPQGKELYPAALVRRAHALSRFQKHQEAISLLKDAIVKDPECVDWVVELSHVLHDANRFEESQKVLWTTIKKRPKEEKLLFALGAILEKQGKTQEALVPMRELLAINPKNAEALNFVGYSLAEIGIELDEAEMLVKKAIDLQPENGAFIDSLGWIYFKKGKLRKAIGLLEKALRLMPDEPAVAEHLGDAYGKVLRKKEAEKSYKKALEMLRWQPDAKVERSIERKLLQLRSEGNSPNGLPWQKR